MGKIYRAAYDLAVQLLDARLNLAAAAETCQVTKHDEQAAQLPLLELKLTG